MKMMATATVALAGLLALGPARAVDGSEEAGTLEVGDVAPDFTLPGSDGQTHVLKDLVGKQAVVLAWFPKAFTSG